MSARRNLAQMSLSSSSQCSSVLLEVRFGLELHSPTAGLCWGAFFSFLKSASSSCEQNGAWCLMKGALQ